MSDPLIHAALFSFYSLGVVAVIVCVLVALASLAGHYLRMAEDDSEPRWTIDDRPIARSVPAIFKEKRQ